MAKIHQWWWKKPGGSVNVGSELKRWGRRGHVSPSWPQLTWCFRNMSKNPGVCCWVWPHKWRQEGGSNLHRWVEDALSTSPQGTGPVHRHPRGCWAGSSGSSYICREAGELWGHRVQESRSCCCSVFLLKIPTGGFLISLCRTQLCPPTPQRQQGEPLVHHQLQREVRAAPPSPVLGSREQSERDTGAQSSCSQGVTWQLCLPVCAPWPWGSQRAWGVSESGVPQDLEPWGPGSAQVPFLNLKLEVV